MNQRQQANEAIDLAIIKLWRKKLFLNMVKVLIFLNSDCCQVTFRDDLISLKRTTQFIKCSVSKISNLNKEIICPVLLLQALGEIHTLLIVFYLLNPITIVINPLDRNLSVNNKQLIRTFYYSHVIKVIFNCDNE